MANYDAQINILVSGQRNINNLANQLNQIESSITEIENRWRSASDAFQRSEIRLRAAGTRQPRGEGGRFARDPDRQARFRAYADRRRALVEQRLARISLSRTTAEAAASREQIDNNERILRQTERRISFESRLNTANERYQYRLQKLRRGGGGRNLSQELQDQARSIQNAYNAAGGAASRNLRLIRSLSIELGVVVERQNEYNRLQALSSKGFEAGRRLQERITDIRNLGVQPEKKIRDLRSQAAQVISASRSGDQQAYSEALRKATAATNRIERESREAAGRIAKFAQRSPVLGGVNFPGSPKALEAQRRAEEAALSAAQKGYPASPIFGTATMTGSPRFLANQERNRLAAERRAKAQQVAEERAAKIQQQVARAAERAADKALREAQKGYPSSPILGTASIQGSPRWVQARDVAEKRLQKAAAAAERAASKALRDAQRGFPSSPILGTPTMPGSPRFLAAQEKARSAAERAFKAQEKAAALAEKTANREAAKILKESQKGYPSSPLLGTATMVGSPRFLANQEARRLAAERRARTQRIAEERAARIQERAARAAEREADKALRDAQRGYPSSPILGTSTMVGSPRYLAAQERARTVAERASRARAAGGGEALSIDSPRRLRSTLASGAIVEQSLINLQNKGVDVTEQLISLQKTLNDAKRDDFQISQSTLSNLQEQVTLAGKRVTLENKRLAGKGGGAKAASIDSQQIESLQEALRNRRFDPIARATNEQLEELARRLQDIRNRADATGDEFRRLGRDLAAIGREQERRDPGADFLTRRVGPRTGRAISEGLVGGAFPLLFGQGIGSSIFGGLGGAVGGFAGGGLGFGLSLLGTALGSAIDETAQKAKTLGIALNKSTADIDAIVESLGEVGNSSVKLIKRLEEVAGKQAALEEATTRLALIVGDDGVKALQDFGDASTELGNALAKVTSQVLAEAAKLLEPITRGIAGQVESVALRKQAFESNDPRITLLRAQIGNNMSPRNEKELEILREIERLQKEINEEAARSADKVLESRINALSPINDALASEQRRYKIALLGGDILNDEVMSLRKTELLSRLRQENQATLNKYLEGTIQYEESQKEFKKNQVTYERELLQLENERVSKIESDIKKIQELNESNAKSYRDMRLQIERQIEDERIAAARRIEDAELKGAKAVLDFKEKGLKIIQNQRREQIELASAIKGLEAQFSANPSREGLAAQLSAAVDQYKNGLAEADENRKLAEEKIQLDAREAALAIERFKQDNARRVARINEDSTRKIAEINDRIDKQRNKSYKYAYDLTIQRLIAQEQSAANQLEQKKAGNDALLSNPLVFGDYRSAIEEENASIDAQLKAVQKGIQRLRRLQSQLPATPQLQNVGSLPVMTSQANEVSAAEKRVNSLIQAGRERLLQLEQQNTKESAAAKLARQNLQIIGSQAGTQTQITESLNKRIEDAQRYKQLLASGINPELAKQVATIEGTSAKISDAIGMTIKQLEALKDPKFEKLIETLRGFQKDQPTIVSEQIDKAKKALELEKPTLVEGISAEINQLEKDLDPITLATNSIINGANAIGTAFGQAFTDVASGAKSTEQALADTFESIGKAFLGMAAEIIAKQLTMIALQTVLKALGAVSNAPQLTTSTGVSMSAGTATQSGFDMGSSLASMFKADGGPVNANQPYIVGERGPELFVPFQQGSITSNEAMQQASMAQLPFTRNAESISQATQTAQAMQAAGPINVKYESTMINGVTYVTEDQHRRGMAQAAERGRALTLQALQNSPRTRSKVGI